jgi:hypothetical protein
MEVLIPAVSPVRAAVIITAGGVATTVDTMAVTIMAATVAAHIMEEVSIRAWRTRPDTHPAFTIRSRIISAFANRDGTPRAALRTKN